MGLLNIETLVAKVGGRGGGWGDPWVRGGVTQGSCVRGGATRSVASCDVHVEMDMDVDVGCMRT